VNILRNGIKKSLSEVKRKNKNIISSGAPMEKGKKSNGLWEGGLTLRRLIREERLGEN